jgi:hypothetical protein
MARRCRPFFAHVRSAANTARLVDVTTTQGLRSLVSVTSMESNSPCSSSSITSSACTAISPLASSCVSCYL